MTTHTETKALVERLRELAAVLQPFAESLVAQVNVKHHSQDWREETDDTVVSITTSHQRKGMPYLAPDHTLWVGAFRRAREAADALPQILAALEPLTREPDADEVERVARAIYESSIPKGGRNYAAWDDLDSFGYETNREDCERYARAAIAALPRRDALREALETIQTVADNERMDATDAHYAVILAGIQATARAALRSGQ